MKKEGHEEIRAEGQYGKVKVTQILRDSRELMQDKNAGKRGTD